MSCACLVLFSGFLFVGEGAKTSVIFNAIAGVCLFVIFLSFCFIGKVVFMKLEEVFHCWNCRRVPLVEVPNYAQINSIAQSLHAEIIMAHTQAAVPKKGGAAAKNGAKGSSATASSGATPSVPASAGISARHDATAAAAAASPSAASGDRPLLGASGKKSDDDKLTSPAAGVAASTHFKFHVQSSSSEHSGNNSSEENKEGGH